MIHFLFTVGAVAPFPGGLSWGFGVFPSFDNLFCKLVTVAVKEALLVVRVLRIHDTYVREYSIRTDFTV